MRKQDGARGLLSYHKEVHFQGGWPPKQVMEVEVERNICGRWQLFNGELLALLHSRGKERWRYWKAMLDLAK